MQTLEQTSTFAGESGDDTADIEGILGTFSPAIPGNELYARFREAFSSGLMADDVAEPESEHVADMVPVTVPTEKIEFWANLMDQAAREVTEVKLSDLKAAPPAEFKLMRWLMAVENTASEPVAAKRPALSARKRTGLWAMSAAATFLAIAGILNFYPTGGKASTFAVDTGNIGRITENIIPEGDLHWNAELGMAEKNYHVDYNDILEWTTENGTKMEIMVPYSQKVTVPVEIY